MNGTVAPPSRRSMAALTCHSWTPSSAAIRCVIDCMPCPLVGARCLPWLAGESNGGPTAKARERRTFPIGKLGIGAAVRAKTEPSVTDSRTSMDDPTSPLRSYLAGTGRDGRGRTIDDVLAFSDDDLERVHDFIQWLFPLPTRSAAQPNAPVLSAADIAAIRSDEAALANLRRASERMLRFYRDTDFWLARDDHNHLRITRILHALRLLQG